MPYFVDDYRILTADVCFSGNPPVYIGRITCAEALVAQYCLPQGGEPPRDFTWEPEYVAVTDLGTTYVLDYAVGCASKEVISFPHRISKWKAAGDYVTEFDIPQPASAGFEA